MKKSKKSKMSTRRPPAATAPTPTIEHSHAADYFAMVQDDRRKKGQPSTLTPEQRSRISNLQTFVTYIETSRAMFRSHPDLVTAPEMPEPYKSIQEYIEWGESSCLGMGCTICNGQDEDEEEDAEDEDEEEEEEEEVPLADAHSNPSETAA